MIIHRQAAVILIFLVLLISGCQRWVDPSLTVTSYPKNMESIFVKRCATAGCHNNASYKNAGNLNLSDWTTLFQGGSNGSVLVPYSGDQSSLLQFINTYADLGLQTQPSMPLNQSPLSYNDVLAVKTWIQQGCPSRNQEIPFGGNPSRKKIYITNQGCDLVSVIDAETQLVMRYVTVGHDPSMIELPHNIQLSEDGKYWYVCFVNGNYFQKYDAATDQLVQEVNVGAGSWNVIKLSGDNQKAYLTDLSSNGKLVTINVNTMTIQSVISGTGILTNPHGVATSITNDTVYITSQYGNMIYRLIPSLSSLEKISLQKNQPPVTTPQLLDPHEIIMGETGRVYFVTCQASNEVRVMDSKMDTLMATIPVGIYPLEMALDKIHHKLYVSCQEDIDPSNSFFKGGVYVINTKTLSVEQVIHEKFYQPHGLCIDTKNNLLYVASRNANPNGPAPHHSSNCGGRNGYYTVIHTQSLAVVVSGFEISVDPYSAAFRP